ncbi:hypothetical protein HDU67_004162, partial [Dinochytrium kinnereticum]
MILGYTQSKYVAETLVLEAGKMGRPCSIYRLGRVTGHSQTGAIPAQDLPFLLLKGIIEMGCFPLDLYAPVDVVPVDYCSSILAHFIHRQTSRGTDVAGGGRIRTIGGGGARHGRKGRARIFHVTHPRPVTLPQVCLWLADMGYSVEGVSYVRWRSKLLDEVEKRHSLQIAPHPLEPFLANFEAGLAEFKWIRFKCDRTVKDAAAGGFSQRIVDVDAHLIRSYVDYLVMSGALPSAAGEALSPTRTVTQRTMGSTRNGSVAGGSTFGFGAWQRDGSPSSSVVSGPAGRGGGKVNGNAASSVGSTAPMLGGRRPSSIMTAPSTSA